MNRVHRLVWNKALGLWVAVAEHVRGRGKRRGRRALGSGALLLSVAAAVQAAPPSPVPTQLPTDGKVVAGGATITAAPAVLTIDQSTSRAAIDWTTFDVGSAAQVNFRQPSADAATLNRVLDSNPSRIFGKITANGQVFLTNPNGIYFGAGASVDVGGLVATTHGLSNADFMAGGNTFTRDGATGGVVNEGNLQAVLGGYIALLAPEVRNAGVVVARLGTVALASGEVVTLDIAGSHLAGITVQPSAIRALVENRGAVMAPGGLIVLSAKALDKLQGGVVRNTGTLEATGLSSRTGRIVLEASDGIEIASTANLDVSGATGGGMIEVGGGWQGTGPLAHARAVTIDAGAKLLASATGDGDGGTIAVWSDGTTRVAGDLQARGAGRGSGGLIETSGHVLDVTGITIDAAAPQGAGGTWLLDPYNLTISAGATTATQAPTGTWTSNAGGSVVLNTTVNTALNAGTAVVLQTSGTLGDGMGNGDITVSSAIAKTAGASTSLTLKAGGSIIVNAGISSTVGALNTTLDANTLGGGGYVNVAAAGSISTNGGSLVIGGGANPVAGAAVGNVTQLHGVVIAGGLTTAAGAITINGAGSATAGNSHYGINQTAAISSGGGNITINGVGGGTGTNEYGVNSTGAITAAGGNIAITGAASTTATGSSDHGLVIDAGSAISTTGSGTITLDGTATGNGTGTLSYGINLLGGGVVSTVNGLLSATGRNNSTGSGIKNNGIYVTGAGSTLKSTGLGAVTVVGSGGGSGAGGSNTGVLWDVANGIQATGTGAVNITGTGGDAGGSGINNYGVNAGAALAAAGGTIFISGTGGNSSGSGGMGIVQSTGAAITNTGSGSIVLNGIGGGTGGSQSGVSSAAAITSGTGNIALTGNAGSTATGSSDHGVNLTAGSAVGTAGSGTITLDGTATGNGTGNSSYGLALQGGAVVSAVDGLVRATGRNNSSGTGNSNLGVLVTGTNSTLKSTGSGGVTVIGYGGGSVGSGSDYGVSVASTNGVQATGIGAIAITGTGGDTAGSGANNYGVNIGSAVAAAGGAVSITGTGGNASGASNIGINQALTATIGSTGAGAIFLNGIGGGTGSTEYGVNLLANVTSGTGTVSITGAASGTAAGANNIGIVIGAGTTVSTGGAGTLTLDGTGTGSATASSGGGVLVSSATVSAVDGLLSVTGRSNSTGTGNNNYGVQLGGTGATIGSGGTGGVTIAGTGGGSGGSSTNYGVLVGFGNSIRSTSGGAIAVTGIGGDAGGSGNSNVGAVITGTIGAGGGALALTGTGSNSSGGSNGGITQSGAITNAGSGGITMIGTAGGSGATASGVLSSGAITAGTGNIAITGAASATGTGAGDQGVVIASTTGVATGGFGTIILDGTATGSGNADATAVQIASGGVSAVDGLIRITGRNNSTTTQSGVGGGHGGHGVAIIGSTIRSTGAGGVTLVGTAGGATTGGYDWGVHLGSAMAVQVTGSGAISITGTGGDTGGSGVNNYGVNVGGAVSANGGAITIVGTGGNTSGVGSTGINQSAAITNTGLGSISLSGTGGGTGASQSGVGSTAAITAGTGNISITGTTSAAATGVGNVGIIMGTGSAISTAGAGSVTLLGTATTSGTGGGAIGVELINSASVVAVDGLISATGLSQSSGSAASNHGVWLVNGGTLRGTGQGGVTVTGTAGGSGAGGGNIGVSAAAANAVQTTGSGSINVTGIGGGAGGSGGGNLGVQIGASAAGGAISVVGTGGSSSGVGNYGINVSAALANTGNGNITLAGTGGGTGSAEAGVVSSAAISAGTGNISISGIASATATGSADYGILLNGIPVGTSGAGTITLDGTATGSGVGSYATGVMIQGGSAVTAVDGRVRVTGRNFSTGANVNAGLGFGNNGVSVSGNGLSTIRSTGSGDLIVVGVAGGSGADSYSAGVRLATTNSVQATGTGAVSITGTSGDAGGTGVSNAGVNVSGAVSASGGAISIIGIGSTSSGTNNFGLSQAAGIINTGGGSITLSGSGQGSGANGSGISSSAAITTGTGNILMTGVGANTTAGSAGPGVILGLGSVASTGGAGAITVVGTAMGSGTASGAMGVELINGATVTTADGPINVTGLSQSTGTGNNNYGIWLVNGGTLKSTGSGNVTIVGTAGGSGASAFNTGVSGAANAIQATGTGAISVAGTGGDSGGSGSNNWGVSLGAAANGGPISIVGTGGNASGSANGGVFQTGPISNAGSGTIALNGTGGGTGDNAWGIYSRASIAGGTGNISLTGAASPTSTGSGSSGVVVGWYGTSLSTGGAGAITIDGTATGGGAGSDAAGVSLQTYSVITGVNGPVQVTGRNRSTGSGTANHGVFVSWDGSSISTTGSGAVTVTGLGGGTGSGSSGVNWSAINGIQATGSGAISITGTGGGGSGSGSANNGVDGTAALSGGGGAISINGTASSSSGANFGISIGSVTAGTGTLTLRSTGPVIGNGAITAANLALLGAGGSYVLNNGGNAVTTLAGNSGGVTYAQTGDLVIGSVGSTTGLTSTGGVLVNVLGNLAIASGAGVSAAGSGDALTLSDSGRFTNNAGAAALMVTGGGRWLVWSADPTLDNRGGLVYGFKEYGATFGLTAAADATRNGFLYRLAPTVTTTLTGTVGKVYDGLATATFTPANYAFAGAIDGDTVVPTIATAGVYDTPHAGTGKLVTVHGLAAGSASNGAATVYGYQLASSAAGAVGTVTPAPLTVTADGGTKTYGGTLAFAGTEFTASGLVNSETIGAVTLASAGSATGAHVAGGPYAVVASSARGGSFTPADYTIGYANGALAVTPASLTITANSQTKIYGSAFAFGGTEFTLMGLLNGDTVGSVGLSSIGAAAAAHVAGSPYVIAATSAVGGTFAASDYTIGYATGALAVTPASLTITANNQAKTYGSAFAFGGLEFTSTGLVNGDTVGSVALSSAGAAMTSHVAGSPYPIVASSAAGGSFAVPDYAIAYTGGALTVSPASLAVATNTQSKPYGTTFVFGGTEFTATGLVNGDTVGSVAMSSTGAPATAHVAGGPYPIAASSAAGGTFAASDYAIAYAGGGLTVTPAALTVTANNQSKTYGGAFAFGGGEFTTVGLANGETIGSATFSSAGSSPFAHVSGGPYAIVASAAGGGTFAASDYSIAYALGALTVHPAALTVTAGNRTKTYGDAVSFFGNEFTSTGLVNGETIGNVGMSSAGAVATAHVAGGPYGIAATSARGGTFAPSDYAIGYVNGALTIAPAALTVTANPQTKTYGDAFAFGGGEFTAAGLANGETVGSATLSSAGSSPLAHVAAGPYAIVASAAGGGTFAASDYRIAYANGALTVKPASLTVAADNATRTYGAADPAFTQRLTSGVMMNGDTLSGSATTTATASSNVGAYAIGQGTVSAGPDYVVRFVEGTLSVGRATLTLSSSDVVKTYDGTGSAAGSPTVAAGTRLFGSDSLSGGRLVFTDANAGTNKTVTIGGVTVNDGNGGGNYAVRYLDNTTSTIDRAPLVLTATVADKVYDGTAAATMTGYRFGGLIGDQTLQATASASTFSDRNAAVGKAVTIGGFVLGDGTNGGLASNYVVGVFAPTTAAIAPKALAVTATVANKVYDGTNAATVQGYVVSGLVGSETLTAPTTGSAAFGDKNAGSGKSVVVVLGAGLADGTNGGLASNYRMPDIVSSQADIAKAPLSIRATGVDRIYDATTGATVTLSATPFGIDAVTAGYGSASFADKNAGSGKIVSVSGITLSGSDAGNYTFAPTASTEAAIGRAVLTVSATGVSKSFDGTDRATVTMTDNRFAGDQVVWATGGVTFVDSLAGKGKPITVVGLRLVGGADRNNYVVGKTTTSTTADILAPNDGWGAMPVLPGAIAADTDPESGTTPGAKPLELALPGISSGTKGTGGVTTPADTSHVDAATSANQPGCGVVVLGVRAARGTVGVVESQPCAVP